MKILLKKGTVIDPVNQLQGKYDVLISENRIVAVEEDISNENSSIDNITNKVEVDLSSDGLEIIDIEGKIVLPGLIDIHTHLREPGFEDKETIRTGCEAAAAGGFTTIACMANTDPVLDNPSTVEFVKARAREAAVRVLPIGSVTRGMKGEQLSEIGFLAREGVKALSEDGKTVMNGDVMRRAMEYASEFGMTIIDHCEDVNLAGEGVMHEGYYSTILGLEPIPAVAEETIIARDIYLAEFTGCPLHIAHLSTKRGVELVVRAKDNGIPVTAEVTPHHLLLTDKAVLGYDPNTKVMPPLRSKEDREALRWGLTRGVIDVIATDHAPHTFEDKLGEFDQAASGISGLETALPLLYDRLVARDVVNWDKLVTAMVYNPAAIMGLEVQGIKSDQRADLTIFDPDKRWTVTPQKFKSKGSTTPFAGEQLTGKTLMTLVNGKIVYDNRGDKNEIIY